MPQKVGDKSTFSIAQISQFFWPNLEIHLGLAYFSNQARFDLISINGI